jgi:hypothetical protein
MGKNLLLQSRLRNFETEAKRSFALSSCLSSSAESDFDCPKPQVQQVRRELSIRIFHSAAQLPISSNIFGFRAHVITCVCHAPTDTAMPTCILGSTKTSVRRGDSVSNNTKLCDEITHAGYWLLGSLVFIVQISDFAGISPQNVQVLLWLQGCQLQMIHPSYFCLLVCKVATI